MQKCYDCGKEVDDNVLICPACGALVKRYGKPVPQNRDDSRPAPAAYPGAYETPERTRREGRISGARCASGSLCAR